MTVPATFRAFAAQSPQWAAFVDRLPRLIAGLVEEWELRPDGDAAHGHCAVVVPVRTAAGRPAALKVSWPHGEAETEHLALQRWGGAGAVRLLRADPRRFALLLERLRTEDLTEVGDLEACEIVGDLYGRLHVPAPPQVVRLATCVDRWTGDLAALPRDAPLPRRLVEQAVAIGRAFGSDDVVADRLLHTDLHFENVLAGDREPWLAIDPKPLGGDPHYELAPMLWNRWPELERHPRGIREAVRLRFHTLVDVAGLDEQRARDWVVFRMLCIARWSLAESSTSGMPDGAADWITRWVTIAKAVQD